MRRKIALGLAMVLCTMSLAACGKQTEPQGKVQGTEQGSAQGEVELKIPHYKAGQNTGVKFFEPQMERFNEKYAGTYKIVIEQMPQEYYNVKMKQLAQQDKLPALVEGGDPEWLSTYIVPNKKYTDLSSWLDERKEIKGYFNKRFAGLCNH